MNKLNGYMIQETIRQCDRISVPEIQLFFSLEYGDAKDLLNQMIFRGWVEPFPKGIFYKVQHKNLQLHYITKEDAVAIYSCVDGECTKILEKLKEKDGMTITAVKYLVRDDDDAEPNLDVLMKLGLIYEHNGMFFKRVSNKTITVINRVCSKKTIFRKNDETNPTEIIKLFSELFD